MAQIVTITNPLTGQPAQVDQLDHTAQQIDDGLNIARGVSNPNLLDNWYFGNPVDQRQGRVVVPNTTYYSNNQLTTAAGTTSAYMTAYRYATGTKNGINYASFKLEDSDTAPTYYAAPEHVVRGYIGEVYGIDRWIAQWTGGGVTLIEDGCISIYRTDWESYICQRITDGLGGQTVTFSALCKGNCGINLIECDSGWAFKSNIAGQGNTVIDDYTLLTVTGVVPQGCKNLLAELTSAQGVKSQFKAAKLELGTQQTLAHQENGAWVLNEIPNYTTEYLKCKRYYRRCGIGLYMTTQATNTFVINFPFDVPMRAAPVANFIRTDFKLYSAMAANPSITVTAPNIIVNQIYEKGVRAIGFQATLSAAFENKMLYRFNSDYDIIELSADL